MAGLLALMSEEITQELEGNSVYNHLKMKKIAEATNKLPGEMGNEFDKRVKEMLKDMENSLR